MQALPQILRLQSLESIIERSQQMIVPETPLLDAMSTMGYAYALMPARGRVS
ncbi:MAG: hypothetical protein V7K14_27675 [Nostoc sp.]|uniref:hypothetical protein n=1 Tax=Nostoc sp. TaxID=1180 RepID=UPI002FF78FEF